jgi:hypothetical protein
MSKELREEYEKETKEKVWFYYVQINKDNTDEETYLDVNYVEWLEQQNSELQTEVERLNDFEKFTKNTVNILNTLGLDHNQKDSSLVTVIMRGEKLLQPNKTDKQQ